MTTCFRILLVLELAFCLVMTGRTQNSSDTSFRQKAISNLIGFYREAVGRQAGLYNAPEFDPYIIPFSKGHPYFQSNALANGTVTYEGIVYPDVPLLYDLVRDELVLLRHDDVRRLNLIKERVECFSIHGHSFVQLFSDTTMKSAPTPGFYDLLFDGAVDLLARRTKNLQQYTEGLSLENKVFAKDHYYVVKDKTYYNVRNKKTLLAVLKDKKSAIQQYIRTNKIQFRHNFEKAAVAIVAYYDQTTK